MFWRKGGISVLPYFDDFVFPKKGKHAFLLLCRKVRKEFFDARLIINEPKCQLEPILCFHELGVDIDMGEGKFRVPGTDGRPYMSSQMES